MDRSLTPESISDFVSTEVSKLADLLSSLADPVYARTVEAVARAVVASLAQGGTIFFCGNGGSAADAQHFAAELVGKQNYDRPPARGIALTVDTSTLTALGNDYGYGTVFSRQIEGLGRAQDVLFAISTSGLSQNVVAGLEAARSRGIITVALTGADPRLLAGADHVIAIPSTETAKIQECHILTGHIILAIVERALFPKP